MGALAERIIFLRARTPRAVALTTGGGEFALGAALYAGASFAALTLTIAMREALDRERAERHLLAELNEEKNQLLGIAAHDLRSPIAITALYTQYLLAEERCGDPRPRRYLEIISRKSEFMLSLVSDVLDFSRIEAGHLELRREAGDWAGFVRECVLLLGELGAHRGIVMRVCAEGPLPPVSFDANRMEQVLSNLVANGLRFSPDGSLLEVTVAPAPGGVVTRVSDRGPGIPEEERARLFEPFRIGWVQPAAQSGTGLGLAIVRRIVTAHGGAVGSRARSAPARRSGSPCPRSLRPLRRGAAACPREPAPRPCRRRRSCARTTSARNRGCGSPSAAKG